MAKVVTQPLMKIRERGSNSANGNKHLINIYKTGLSQSHMDNKEHQLRHGKSSSI